MLSARVWPKCGQRGRATKLVRSAADCQGRVDTGASERRTLDVVRTGSTEIGVTVGLRMTT